MKKTLALLTMAGLMLVAIPAFAHDKEHTPAIGFGNKMMGEFHDGWFRNLSQDQFMLSGTVVSTASGSITINVLGAMHVGNLTNNQATVIINNDTKIIGRDKSALALGAIQVGDKVAVSGSVAGVALTAKQVQDMTRPSTKASGKVTAKTDNSITITNALTGASQTVTADSDTKVMINGETKTLADVAVGDSGWVKFKNQTGVLIAKFIGLFR